MKVIDLFCGCGGISLGFQMAGFEVIFGLDNDKDSIGSFQRNFPNAEVACTKIEDLHDVEIPEADIIVGGPPCVNFSSSKGSRANVLDGLALVQAFLRFVWERQPKYWIMENVPRIGLHLPENIPLRWIGVDQDGYLDVPNRHLFSINEYGAPQRRQRLLIGNYPIPRPEGKIIRTLGDVVSAFPKPAKKVKNIQVIDPVYDIELPSQELTDHFHDTILSETETRRIREGKVEHPYMGKMSFPDDLNKPARTIVGLQMGRETLVIQAGKNKYRRATIRECASLQCFPTQFQFCGKSFASRYKQAGNAVPPLLTHEIARSINFLEGIQNPESPIIHKVEPFPDPVNNGRKKERKINYNKPRVIHFPGKELRGFRIEIRSSINDNNIVSWFTEVHEGEGKANHRVIKTDLDGAELLALDSFSSYDQSLLYKDSSLLSAFTGLKEDLEFIDFESSVEAHKFVHETYGLRPDSVTGVISLLDKYFPKEEYSNLNIDLISPIEGLTRQKLRVRLIASVFLAKVIETKLNSRAERL